MGNEKISELDLEQLKYFWEDKGDLERFVKWESLLPKLREQQPQVLKAWIDYKASIKIMDAVMKNLI